MEPRRVFNDAEHDLIRRGQYTAAKASWARRQVHRTRREGDELVCSCGCRWAAVGEIHP